MLFYLFPIIHHPVQFLPPPCPVFVDKCKIAPPNGLLSKLRFSTRNRKSLDFQGFFCFQNEPQNNLAKSEFGLFIDEEIIIDTKTMRYIQRFSYSKNEISVA